MISTVTNNQAKNIRPSTGISALATNNDDVSFMDDRSSSLSDPDDGIDDRIIVHVEEFTQMNEHEVDSEAETERLEKTPRKATGMQQIQVEKSPSKLAQEVLADADSPDPVEVNDTTSTPSVENVGSPSRKRKRTISEPSSLSEIDVNQPPQKRSQSSGERVDEDDGQHDATNLTSRSSLGREEEVEQPEEAAVEEEDNGILRAEAGDEDVDQREQPLLPVIKVGRGRKGKRRGRKWYHNNITRDVGDASDTGAQESGDQPADEEADEEESGSLDEERVKRKTAMDALANLEKEFTGFRQSHLSEQIRQMDHELEMLQEGNSTHPEYLAQMRCIDARRDEKMRYDNVLLRFDIQALRTKTTAERQTFHSQFFQEVRNTKDTALESAWKEYFALQRDRRSWGADTSDFTMLYNPLRSTQIRQQTARNLEVSILAGIAKHVGFPSAPTITGLSASEMDRDFQAMGVQKISIPFPDKNALLNAANADGATAEAQFLEQNPWANPQHPAHAHAAYATLHASAQVANIATPAKQIRLANAATPHDSASTIEMGSNPPSSTIVTHAVEPHTAVEVTESPNMGMKGPLSISNLNMATASERISTSHGTSNPIQPAPVLSNEAPLTHPASAFTSYPTADSADIARIGRAMATQVSAGGARIAS